MYVVLNSLFVFYTFAEMCLKLVLASRDLGYKAYRVEAVDDLTKPFVSMYFGAAYLAWLSEYEGR